MKTIAINLFVFLFLTVSMPIQAEWESNPIIDKITNGKNEIIYTIYREDTKLFVLAYYCKHKTFGLTPIFAGLGSLGKEYEDGFANGLLIWFDEEFDEESGYMIDVFKTHNSLAIQNDVFLSEMKKHQTLFTEIHLWPDEYVTTEFDISGFDEAYEKHCGNPVKTPY